MDERPSYRLPRNVVPDHYSLVLVPDLVNAAFGGEAIVDVRVGEPAAEVVLNAAELDISEARFARDGEADRPATVSYRTEEEQAAPACRPSRSNPAPTRCTCGSRASSTTCSGLLPQQVPPGQRRRGLASRHPVRGD